MLTQLKTLLFGGSTFVTVKEIRTGEVTRAPTAEAKYVLPTAERMHTLGLGLKQSIDWRFTNKGTASLALVQDSLPRIVFQPGESQVLRTRRMSDDTYGTFVTQ